MVEEVYRQKVREEEEEEEKTGKIRRPESEVCRRGRGFSEGTRGRLILHV